MDLNGKKIAVAGVSADEGKYGHRIFRDLLDAGYDVAGVNPGNGTVLGKRIYRNLAEMEYVPDIVVMVVSPAATEQVVKDAIAKGVKTIWMQPGSESDAAVELARRNGIDVTFNNCVMVASGVW